MTQYTHSPVSPALDINSFPDDYYLSVCQQYISHSSKYLLEEIVWLCNDTQSYSIPIDLLHFHHYSPVFGNLVFLYPDRMLLYINQAINKLKEKAIEFYTKNRVDKYNQLKPNIKIHARFTHFPVIPHLVKSSINSIKSHDVGRLILISGTVIRVGSIKLHEISREFQCQKCHHRFVVETDTEQQLILPPPAACPNIPQCRNTNPQQFQPTENKHIRDFQRIKLQESHHTASTSTIGLIPRSMLIILSENLVDTVRAGDEISVIGIVRRSWPNNLVKGNRIDLELYLEANNVYIKNNTEKTSSIAITEEQQLYYSQFWHNNYEHTPIKARDYIISAVCPSLFGLYIVKLALLLTLIAGCSKQTGANTKIRGESHLLLVGDPGTGKCFGKGTQLLSAAGNSVAVEDVNENTKLLGPDGKIRNVMPETIIQNKGLLYKIQPISSAANAFICNGDHILVLKNRYTGSNMCISVNEYLSLSKPEQECYSLTKSGPVTFYSNSIPIRQIIQQFSESIIDEETSLLTCWLLGLCLTHIHNPHTNTNTPHNRKRIKEWANKTGCNIPVQFTSHNFIGQFLSISSDENNLLYNLLNYFNLLQQNEIPLEILQESVAVRTAFIAGILDGNAEFNPANNGYQLQCKSKSLLLGMNRLALSLGFRVNAIEGSEFGYNTIWQCNTNNQIPLNQFIASPNKRIHPNAVKTNVNSYDFVVECIGIGDYYGFEVDSDHQFLLSDHLVTHNSQLLRFAAKLSHRGILTSGTGSSSAGLTVSAVRESGTGDWSLEAGALVLADLGVCCIDEFGCISSNDRSAIHEAMEQQTLSVAKAGLVCSLHTRCSVIASLNPKQGEYNAEADLTANTAISSPLLSRFDVILVLLDCKNERRDRQVAKYILENKPTARLKQEIDQETGEIVDVCTQEGNSNNNLLSQDSYISLTNGMGHWSMQCLQSYIYHVKRSFNPKLTPFAQEILQRYYAHQRQSDQSNSTRTTVRLLESLIRLSQAHARLMFRHIVLSVDAITAIIILEASVQSTGILQAGYRNYQARNNPAENNIGLQPWSSADLFGSNSITKSALHMDFPIDSDAEYIIHRDIILTALQFTEIPVEDNLHSRGYYDHCYTTIQEKLAKQLQHNNRIG